MSKFQPGERARRGKRGETRERHAALGAESRIADRLDAGKLLAEPQHDAVQRRVGYEKVCSVTDEKRLFSGFGKQSTDCLDLRNGGRQQHRVAWAADAERAVAAHRLVFEDRELRAAGARFPEEGTEFGVFHPSSTIRSWRSTSTCAAL